MPNLLITATLDVTIDGQKLTADVQRLLTYAVVETTRALPGMFELHYSDADRKVVEKARLKVGAVVALAVASNEGAAKPLLEGEIVALEAEYGPTGALTIVRGYDRSYRLVRRHQVKAYQNQKAADIGRAIAGDHGLSFQGSSTLVHEHVLQAGTSDWDFLHELAAAEGLALTFSNKKLSLDKPDEVARGSASASPRTDATVLQVGANVRWIRSCVTASDQLGEIEVRGWDHKQKKAVVGKQAPATVSARLGQVTPASMARAIPSGHAPVQAPIPTPSALATGIAKGLADSLGGAFAELEAVVTGNPALVAGGSVGVRGMGAPFDGGYVLSQVSHRFEPGEDGYTTAVRVSSAADRTTRGVLTGGLGGGPEVGSGTGSGGTERLLIGVVTNNKDPDELGRVKLKLPTLSDDVETWWAPVVYAGAGNDQGFVMVPQVGDVVLTAVPHSPLSRPWVLGGLHQQDKTSPLRKEGVEPGTATWVGRTGMGIQIVEKSGGEMIRITLTHAKDDKDAITIAKDASKGLAIISSGPISVTAEKNVEITAKQDVKVTTSSGRISLSGNEIELEGKSKIALSAPQLDFKADGKAAMSGTQLELKANAMAELSASGILTVKGSLVKIN